MMKKIEVEVTALDIKRGIKGDPYRCPVARALRRASCKRDVVAGMGNIFIGPPSDRRWWHTPADVREFIDDFDNGAEVSPMKFTLFT